MIELQFLSLPMVVEVILELHGRIFHVVNFHVGGGLLFIGILALHWSRSGRYWCVIATLLGVIDSRCSGFLEIGGTGHMVPVPDLRSAPGALRPPSVRCT